MALRTRGRAAGTHTPAAHVPALAGIAAGIVGAFTDAGVAVETRAGPRYRKRRSSAGSVGEVRATGRGAAARLSRRCTPCRRYWLHAPVRHVLPVRARRGRIAVAEPGTRVAGDRALRATAGVTIRIGVTTTERVSCE